MPVPYLYGSWSTILEAHGSVFGLTRGATKEDQSNPSIIAYQVRIIIDTMQVDTWKPLSQS